MAGQNSNSVVISGGTIVAQKIEADEIIYTGGSGETRPEYEGEVSHANNYSGVAMMASGEVEVGANDVIVTLPFDWSGGTLKVTVSTTEGSYFERRLYSRSWTSTRDEQWNVTNTRCQENGVTFWTCTETFSYPFGSYETSHSALTNSSLNTGHIYRSTADGIRYAAGYSDIKQDLLTVDTDEAVLTKGAAGVQYSGIPKAAANTSFTLRNVATDSYSGAFNVYAKWEVTAPAK